MREHKLVKGHIRTYGASSGRPNACSREGDFAMRLIADFIFLVLFFVFVVGWLIAWAAFHVAGGGIHLLLILAVIFLISHFFHRRAV